MSWQAPVLPLAPRPLPGEGVLSWVGRIAARYDLDAPGLVALLYPPMTRVHPSRVAALDWSGEAGLDQALAVAARLDPGRVAALRVALPADPARAGPLRRRHAVWCDLCVRDDVARHGETYERAIWRLGWCVACPVHSCRLGEVCPSCMMGPCGFRPVAGRVRLVCSLCRGPVDAGPPAKEWRSHEKLAEMFAAMVAPKAAAPVLALQAALLAACAGAAPLGPLGFGLDAEAFLSLAHCLACPFPWPVQSGVAVAAEHEASALGRLSILGSYRRLGILADVLAAAVAGTHGAAESACAALPIAWREKASRELASALGCYFGSDREKLRRRAAAWGPALEPLVLGLLDGQDERAQQRAAEDERAREEVAQARREIVAAREAAKRSAAELRRIRARRAQRAELKRLRQQYEKRRSGT